jgi:hypothetical protein
MTFDDVKDEIHGLPTRTLTSHELEMFAERVWQAAQEAERERIKSRVKEAAKSIWAVRDLVDNRYGLYIGPPLNTMEQFVEKLMEE